MTTPPPTTYIQAHNDSNTRSLQKETAIGQYFWAAGDLRKINAKLPVMAMVQRKIPCAGENTLRNVGKDTGLCLTRGLHRLHWNQPHGLPKEGNYLCVINPQ